MKNELYCHPPLTKKANSLYFAASFGKNQDPANDSARPFRTPENYAISLNVLVIYKNGVANVAISS